MKMKISIYYFERNFEQFRFKVFISRSLYRSLLDLYE